MTDGTRTANNNNDDTNMVIVEDEDNYESKLSSLTSDRIDPKHSSTSRTASISSDLVDSTRSGMSNPVKNDSVERLQPISTHSRTTTEDTFASPNSRPLRHDEQACEAHYDERDEADDDLEKGKIHFPQHVLYGRQKESRLLEDLFDASVDEGTLKIAFLEGASGVGKSALVWESLLYGGSSNSQGKEEKRIRRRRSCWIASGKYNHNSTSQPFSALLHSLDMLVASVVEEAVAALDDLDAKKPDMSKHDHVVAISRKFASWFDSDDASTLISFCSSVETAHTVLKRLWKRSRKIGKNAHHSQSESGNTTQRSPMPPVLQRRTTSGSQNNSDNNREVSETSSILSEDVSSTAADQQSLLASKDTQQLALAVKAFLQCLSSPSRPLIWFLDDLQWADAGSLQLIQYLLVISSSGSRKERTVETDSNGVKDIATLECGLSALSSEGKNSDHIVGVFLGAYRPSSHFSADVIVGGFDESSSTIQSEEKTNGDIDESPLCTMVTSVTKAVPSVLQINVANLTPKAILEFCCATLDMEEEEGWSLTNALYSATMGNIFHCRQALEHLVRSNCLYYDVMFFSWTYNLPEDGSALQDVVEESCQDVLALVQSKLDACSELVRAILIRAAYTENTVFGAVLLLSLLQVTGFPELTKAQLRKALEEATNEGLLLNATWDVTSSEEDDFDGMGQHQFHLLRYKFSHDKVKEATYRLLPESGPARERVLLPLSMVLIQWALQTAPSSCVSADPQPSDAGLTSVPYTVTTPLATSANRDWMWFVGVQHLNSIPVENILGTASGTFLVSTSCTLPPIEINRKRLAQWNLRVAEMSIAHCSYKQAMEFLKAAISYLEPNEMWQEDGPYYKLSLQLYNKLMEIAIAQGHFEETKDAIAIVLAKAGSLQHKITAFSTKVKLAVELNDRNHEFGITECLNVLNLFGMKLPPQPTSIDAGLEKMKFKMDLQGRPFSILGELDLIPPNDPKGELMKLFAELLHMVLLAKKPQHVNLTDVVALRAMRWTLENGISQHFALLLSEYSAPLRSKGELHSAGKYAAIVKRLFQRFAEELGSSVIRSSDFLFCEFILHGGMLPLQNHPIVDSLEKFIDIYRHALANGSAEYAMSSAMHYHLTYFACGRSLNALLDAKLVLFQDKAVQLQMHGFSSLFYCARHVLYNFQGKNHGTPPTEFPGEAQVLSKLEGRMKDMTIRDFAIYRMILAVVFGDLDCMEQTMNQLENAPLFDLSFARHILRLTFCGIAAYLLGRDGRSPKKNSKIASEIVKELKKLDRADGTSSKDVGSVNFRPIVLCLAAVEADKLECYDAAIAACSKRQLLHLKALMCEHAGIRCLKMGQKATRPPFAGGKPRMKTSPKRNSDPKREQSPNTGAEDGFLSKVPLTDEGTELGRQFLGKAMWSYQDWNASAKVSQLKKRYPFLKNLTRRAAGVSKASASSSVGSLYSNESIKSKSQGTRPSTYFPSETELRRATSDGDSIRTNESN